MKLRVFADIHFGPISGGVYKGVQRKLTQLSEPVVVKLIDKINNDRPDVAICLGDLIQDANNANEDTKNFQIIWKILGKIQVPFFTCFGNHDLRALDMQNLLDITGYKSTSFSKNIAGYHLVFLNHEKVQVRSEKDGGISKTRTVSGRDLEWLENDLKDNNLPSLVFTHYGLAEDKMIGNFWFDGNSEKAVLQNRNQVKQILKSDENLIAVFSGHQHWTKKVIEDGVTYYIVGSLIENTNFDGVPDAVYYDVEINGRKINVSEKHLE